MSEKVTVVFEAKTDKAVKDTEKLKKGIKDTGKESKKAKGSLDGVTASANAATGGLISMGRAGMASLKGVISGFRTLKGAIVSTGIGALVIAFASLASYFTRTEKGAQTLRVATAAISAGFNTFLDVVSKLGEKLVGIFTNPKQALIDFKDAFVANIIERFNSFLDTLGFVASAVKKVFKGDFSGALEDVKSAGSEMVDVMTGVPNTLEKASESAKEFAKEIRNDVTAATELERALNNVRVQERELIVERARANKEIAKARLIAMDETKTQQERLEAIRLAGQLEEEVAQKEMTVQKERLRILEEQAALSDSNEETLEEIAQARARVLQLEQATIQRQKRLATETEALEREIAAEDKKRADEKAKRIAEEEKARIEALEALREANATEKENEIFEVNDKYDKLVALAEKYGQDTTLLEQKRQEELNALKQKEIDDERALQDSKVALAEKGAQAIGTLATALAGDNEKAQKKAFQVNKALNIGTAIMNTANAISGALATTNPIPGGRFIEAGIAGIQGLAQVLAIKNTKFGDKATGSTPPPQEGGAFGRSLAPSVGVAGASTNSSTQLLGAIQRNTDKPQRAYVVGQEVTTQQGLDRSIIENATFG